jgi:D-alanyl-lipoteichoic acid acyltransferase DltB (MBOAT superfamily)
MLFNSINFAIFLPIIFLLYWIVAKRGIRLQNSLLLIASYYFYSCWDWRFLFLLAFSTLLDYLTGIKIYEEVNKTRKLLWLWLSIGINLGFLGVFKYYNFFASSFSDALSLLGLRADFGTLEVILPLGISFYTFHGISYVIDLYNNRITPERNFINYSVFVSFFPLLVAGPIERATTLLPQIIRKREFEYQKAVDGLRQILWGLFKKIVIADNCDGYVSNIFNHYANYSGGTLILGAFLFTVQIYCDFSGYSDIALGSARLFGIELSRNFAFPYFSRNIAEFWRRWHISLTSWFRDYLYIPLGGSRGGSWIKIRNTFIIFIVSGFWHGPYWICITWGLLNAFYILPSILLKTNRDYLEIVAKGKNLPSLKEFLSMFLTFWLTVFAWIFFRSKDVQQAIHFIARIFTSTFFDEHEIHQDELLIPLLILILIFFTTEWIGREQQYALARLGFKWKWPLRYALYYSIVLAIYLFGGKQQQFIYFQF